MYTAMAGLHGYLPNVSEQCDTYENAVMLLAQIHDLSTDDVDELRKYGYIALDIQVYGNEYAEIAEE